MTHYEPSTPRVACGIGAMAMAALTFVLMVGLPAANRPGADNLITAAAPEPASAVTRTAAGPVQATGVADCKWRDSLQAREVEPPRERES